MKNLLFLPLSFGSMLMVGTMLTTGAMLTGCSWVGDANTVKVEGWQSPEGTVRLDYLLGNDPGSKSATIWLDSIKNSFRKEDPQVRCQACLLYQSADYLTYYLGMQTLPTEYYEGDQNSRMVTFSREDGHVVRPSELTDDMAQLARQVLAHTRLENDWVVEAMGGEEAFLAAVRDFEVGVTTRGLTFSFPVMKGTWQFICTIPSSEVKIDM